MKPIFLTLALWSTLFAAALEGAPLESQFRSDLAVFVSARATQPVQSDAVSKTVDAIVSQVKSSFPGVLKDGEVVDTPTDEALRRAYAELESVGAGSRLPVAVSLYVDLWKAGRLNSQQKIIFDRLMRAVLAATEKQKSENGG